MIKQNSERNNLRLFLPEIDVKLIAMGYAKLKKDSEKIFTVEEYLKLEREAVERHEYFDGEIILMAGESDNHGTISANISGELYLQLKGKDCQLRIKDAKIKSGGFAPTAGKSTKGIFSYPDLVIVCGEVKHYDKKKDIILNPKIIVEVLSESTEIFDRNDKFTRYKMFNETLTDYVLISQDKPQIEHFIRQEDNSWKMFTYIGLDKNCRIESIECELKLAEIYDRIVFSQKTLNFLKEIESLNE
ncbi:MAG: Uma2 family endonuclease [Acidobacteriota bacterium]|nr:Uma2 family endonuclease [Acidobacteriota bacterium]